MDRDVFRSIALSLPEAEEKAHFGKPDFRVRNRIFASLPAGHAVVKLTPDQQEMLTAAEPDVFASVGGGWGRQGWTKVAFAGADEATVRSALTTAWRNVAPVALIRSLGPSTAAGGRP